MKRITLILALLGVLALAGCATPSKSQQARGMDANDVRRERAKTAALVSLFAIFDWFSSDEDDKPAEKPAPAPAPAK